MKAGSACVRALQRRKHYVRHRLAKGVLFRTENREYRKNSNYGTTPIDLLRLQRKECNSVKIIRDVISGVLAERPFCH